MTDSKHGGKRLGAGRPPIKDEQPLTAVLHVRMTAQQKQKVDLLGGSEWVRRAIDRARVPGEQTGLLDFLGIK